MLRLGSLVRVRHINCGTFKTRFGGPPLVSHVLVCEFDHGVLLVDSGVGVADVTHATARLGTGFRLLLPALDTAETALEQLKALGYSAGDVKDIVLTHLDLDHAGGAVDFPAATVHTTATELSSALTRNDMVARVRYREPHLAAVKDRTTGYDDYSEELFGFTSHALHDSLRLIPMPGHTAGHSAVAVRDPERGWLLHAGDAFHHRRALTGERSGIAIAAAEMVFADDRNLLRANQRRLAQLVRLPKSPQIFCAHDPIQFRKLAP
ncbi:MBL fold metallo-hydrolase [Rhodococcus qingshengii]|uniref:MBL fold metallo-hydrolase n=1 Tax=Rhodococcus qingshengii TaxID=334542 RepID=UPI0036D95CD9